LAISLVYPSKEEPEEAYFTRSNYFYLPSQRLEEGERGSGWHPVVYLLYEDDYKTNVGACGEGGCDVTGSGLSGLSREMENISRVPTFGDFVTEASMQDITVARLQSTRVKAPRSPL
jgi:hypothetical protein